MKLSGCETVRLSSVPSYSRRRRRRRTLLRRVWPGGQEISIDYCTARSTAADASSVTLSAGVYSLGKLNTDGFYQQLCLY